MTDAPGTDLPDDWKSLWNEPDESVPDVEDLRERLSSRRRRERTKRVMELVAVALGIVLTVGFLIASGASTGIVVLAGFCWTVWAVAGAQAWRMRRSESRALESPPRDFLRRLREHIETRHKAANIGGYLVIAVGMFSGAWFAWRVVDRWAFYTANPWRAVLGGVGLAACLVAAVYLHRLERRRVRSDKRVLEQFDEG